MIREFVEAFEQNEEWVRQELKDNPPHHYIDIVTAAIRGITVDSQITYNWMSIPDHERIVEIDHGDYQGTYIYVIGETDYQPRDYWYVRVGYGTCSGCDELQAILEGGTFNELIDLTRRIVQELKPMGWNHSC